MPFIRQCGKKNGKAGQATHENKGHAHCMLETLRYKYTLTICNTFCLATASLILRTRLNITLHVHSLCCYNICKFPFLPILSVGDCNPHKSIKLLLYTALIYRPLQWTQNSFCAKQDLQFTRITREDSILMCSVRTEVVKISKRSCSGFLDKEKKFKNCYRNSRHV